jgi:hypothetical protein
LAANIGLADHSYEDKLYLFVHRAKTCGFSFNAKLTFEVGRIVVELVKRTSGLEANPYVQTFTFKQALPP